MAMTMTQKILARAAGLEQVTTGELLECDVSLVLGNDITAPVAIEEFIKMGAETVFSSEKIALVPDHFTPNKDIKSAHLAKTLRDFSKKHDITHYYEVGRGGVEHALLPEKGLVAPGELIIGADSHTCTYGALNAFSTGVGSTDMAAGMATGKVWLRVPEAIRIELSGKLQPYVTGKDIILHIIGMLGVDGARYMSLEFGGPGMKELSIDSRLAMANMAIEAGAKNGIFECDAQTLHYVQERVRREYKSVLPDADAKYARVIELDLSTIPLTVALPHLPENTKPAAEITDMKVDQVIIGSCTNGRMEDMRIAAELLKGKRVHPDVRLIIIPATQEIYRQCLQEGLFEIFVDAGAAVSTPTCGPCLGGHMGILAEGERAVATTNRNFVGRMGHTRSEVVLAGPAVAAASAIVGKVSAPL